MIGPGSNSGPLDQQSDLHLWQDMLPTARRGPGLPDLLNYVKIGQGQLRLIIDT